MTKSSVMTRAWELYKAAGCTMRAEFGLALRTAWAEAKAPVLTGSEKQVAWANDIINKTTATIANWKNEFVVRIENGTWDADGMVQINRACEIANEWLNSRIAVAKGSAAFVIKHRARYVLTNNDLVNFAKAA